MNRLRSTSPKTKNLYYELAKKGVPCKITEETRKLIRGIRHNLPPVPQDIDLITLPAACYHSTEMTNE